VTALKTQLKGLDCIGKQSAVGYNRDLTINREYEGMLNNVLNETGHAGNKLRRKRLLKKLVADNPRCGAPAAYTLRQYTDIVKIALQKPSEYDRPITHWTARELTDEVHKQQIALGISRKDRFKGVSLRQT